MVHPFPSFLDGLVVAGTAFLAGGGVESAVRLGLSMVALQFAIGALNDLVDAPRDFGHVPPKPIPSGQVSVAAARAVVVVSALAGVALAAPSGGLVVGLALVVLAVGAVYDLGAKGTAWSWLPFAIGIPILPVYGWLGATSSLPAFFVALVPMAVLAGAALALANAYADLEADVASGTRSVATALGARRSTLAGAVLMLSATAIGFAYRDPLDARNVSYLVTIGTLVVIVGLGRGARGDPGAARIAWGLQAVGAAVAGIGWLAVFLA